MSRRYPTAELYEERERDFYRNGNNRSRRSYDELDFDLRESLVRDHGDPRRSQPDFLREDYGRTTAGPLALRKSRTENFDDRASTRHGREEVERDEIIIRNDRRSAGSRAPPPPPEPEFEREEIVFREKSGRPSRPPQPREVEKEEIIIRRREEDDVHSRATSRRPPPSPVDDEVRSVKTNRSKATTRGRERDVDREEIIIRREESRGPPPRGRDSVREDEREEIQFRRGNGPRAPPSSRGDIERDEFIFRREERDAPPPGPPPPRSSRGGDFERDEFIFRREERDAPAPAPGPPPPRSSRGGDIEREEIIFRRQERDSSAPAPAPPAPKSKPREVERDDFYFRREQSRGPPRERSAPAPRLVAREREDFVLRRRQERPPSPPLPPPEPTVEKQEIIIRRRERSPSPSPSRSPSPPPPPPVPEPILRPPIIQEIITHHRHIDHGVERAYSTSPSPPPPESPASPKEDDFELSIRRRTTSGGRFYEEDIIFENSRDREPSKKAEEKPKPKSKDKPKEKPKEKKKVTHESEEIKIKETDDSSGDENFQLSITRKRSQSAAPRDREVAPPTSRRDQFDDDIQAEADFYNRKAEDRGYPGEAMNGATKDWGLVDVPPGTRKVRMDGAGGAGQEITWERYSGNRRSKFITDDGEYASDFGRGAKALAPPPPKKEEMWTEITKDLVIEDAIKTMGYQYEETESFYYVMEYLRYEDVLQLVELSDDIRRDRKSRIREIQWEREEIRHPPPPKSSYDEIVFEREVIHDHRGRRYR